MPKPAVNSEKKVLVLQGGGALGAYQAGAYEALAAAGLEPVVGRGRFDRRNQRGHHRRQSCR